MEDLKRSVREFAEERDWKQFHTPKNLSMALAVEAAEIMEHFQWLTAEESLALDAEKRRRVGEEIGDVLLYLVGLADRLGLDPIELARRKLEDNRRKYPAEKVRGKALKYTEYPSDGESEPGT
ncbi:MAG: nucleotide pyrophosphohydrolase [Planctomycetota bacterium]|nr:nucleotide pyrophosphohydrolase [Planctomycetota bacterium]